VPRKLLRAPLRSIPINAYAGFHLFHLQISSGEVTAATETLNRLCRGGNTDETLACSVDLAIAQQEPTRAMELFGDLCSREAAKEWSIVTAVKALNTRGLRHSVDKLIDERLSKISPPPALAEFWVDRQIQRGRWGLHSRLNSLKAEGQAGRRAVLRYLDRLGNHAHAARQRKDLITPLRLRYHLWRLLASHRFWLQSDVEGWGKVGYVLTCIGRPAPVIAWLSDWKNRPQAESWMLYNLVIMLHRKGHYEESLEIIRHAVTLRHNKDLYETFRAWTAFEEALAGNFAAAERHLVSLPAEDISEQLRPLQVMTQLLLAQPVKSADQASNIVGTIRSRLRSAFGQRRPYETDQYTRDGYARFIGAAARAGGGMRLRMWGWWFYRGAAWSWMLLGIAALPAVLAAPPLGILIVIAWLLFFKALPPLMFRR